jgi:hypothetical protein
MTTEYQEDLMLCLVPRQHPARPECPALAKRASLKNALRTARGGQSRRPAVKKSSDGRGTRGSADAVRRRATKDSASDGHMLVMVTNSSAIAVSLLKTQSYNVTTDLAAVSLVGSFEFYGGDATLRRSATRSHPTPPS